MNYLNLKIINQIIERDSKDTTYKFALLKGTIELIQDYHHFLTIKKDVVEIPLGLLVEKWMFYYYPIISSNLKQKKGEKEAGFTISFRKTFREVIKHYTNIGGFSVFYNEYMNDLIPNNIKPNVLKLISELRKTLINLPMRYIGNSYFKKNYSIFHPHNNSSRIKDVNRKTIIENSAILFLRYSVFENSERVLRNHSFKKPFQRLDRIYSPVCRTSGKYLYQSKTFSRNLNFKCFFY